MPCDWFFCFRLRQSDFHYIVNDGVISGVGRKWNRSDSSDSHSVVFMTPPTTPIFDCHQVTPTPTLSLARKPAFKHNFHKRRKGVCMKTRSTSASCSLNCRMAFWYACFILQFIWKRRNAIVSKDMHGRNFMIRLFFCRQLIDISD